MNFCLYPFIFFGPNRWNVRIVRRNVRNIRSLFVSHSLVFSFQRKIVNVCFPVDGHILFSFIEIQFSSEQGLREDRSLSFVILYPLPHLNKLGLNCFVKILHFSSLCRHLTYGNVKSTKILQNIIFININ